MAGKTKINGTAYTIKGGKTKVGGTAYSIKGGKTLKGGTGYKISFGRLPSAYQEVEYIESTGTQYIETGVIAASGMQIEGDLCFNQTVVADNFAFMLSSQNGGPNRPDYTSYIFVAYGGKWRFGCGYQGTHTAGSTITAGQRYNLTATLNTNSVLTVNNSEQIANNAPSNLFANQIPLAIFANKYYASTGYQTKGRLYSLKISQNGTPVRDFVPCYRISDNVIGLYDLVGNQFYTNAGSGTFNKGPNV